MFRQRRPRKTAIAATAAAIVVFSVAPAFAAWTTENGTTGCISPKTVTTQVNGTDDHLHIHNSGGTALISRDLSWGWTYRNYGWTNTGWTVGALGNLNKPNSGGTCTT